MTGDQAVKQHMGILRAVAADPALLPELKAALDFALANLSHVENPPTVGALRERRNAAGLS